MRRKQPAILSCIGADCIPRKLGAVGNSTISDVTPRFSAIRCSHTFRYAALRFLEKASHLDIANCQQP